MLFYTLYKCSKSTVLYSIFFCYLLGQLELFIIVWSKSQNQNITSDILVWTILLYVLYSRPEIGDKVGRHVEVYVMSMSYLWIDLMKQFRLLCACKRELCFTKTPYIFALITNIVHLFVMGILSIDSFLYIFALPRSLSLSSTSARFVIIYGKWCSNGCL